jgi:hypothetical protein
VEWANLGENEHSGFWLQAGFGKHFFLTVIHFHNRPAEEGGVAMAETQKRMEDLRGNPQHKCYVGTRLDEHEIRKLKLFITQGLLTNFVADLETTFEVKILDWNLPSNTAIFEVKKYQPKIRDAITLEEIGFVEGSLLNKRAVTAFTAGYSADDQPASEEDLILRGFKPEDLAAFRKSGLEPFTLFKCNRASTSKGS